MTGKIKSGMKIFYVCGGNTCRSPMAAVITREEAKERGLELFVDSGGIGISNKRPDTDEKMNMVLLEKYPRYKVQEHTPRVLTQKDLEESDIILTLGRYQVEPLLDAYGKAVLSLKFKLFVITEYTGTFNEESSEVIKDPFGGKPGDYRKCRNQISKCVKRILSGRTQSADEILRKREEAKARNGGYC